MIRRTALVLGAVLAIAFAGSASAYTGHGDENLPCTTGGYWVLNHLETLPPGLTVDGAAAVLVKVVGNGSTAHYESGPVTADSVVIVTPNVGQLQLSHCLGGASSSPSPSASPSSSPSPSPSVSPDPSATPTPSATTSPAPTQTPTSSSEPSVTPRLTAPPTDTASETAAQTSSPSAATLGLFMLAFALSAVFVSELLRKRR